METRFETLRPGIADLFSSASEKAQLQSVRAAVDFAIKYADVSDPLVIKLTRKFCNGETLASDEKDRLEALIEEFDNEGFDLRDSAESGAVGEYDWMKPFSKARALSALSYAFSKAGGKAIYEAANAVEDKKQHLIDTVVSTLEQRVTNGNIAKVDADKEQDDIHEDAEGSPRVVQSAQTAHVAEEDDAFFNLLNHEDDLAAVLRAQLHIESLFDELLTLSIKNPSAIYQEERFSDSILMRLRCAYAFGVVSKDVFDTLTAVHQLRNKFAHGINRTLDDADLPPLLTSEFVDSYYTTMYSLESKDASTRVRRALSVIRVYIDSLLRERRSRESLSR